LILDGLYAIPSGGGSRYARSELFNVYKSVVNATPYHWPLGVPEISVHEGTLVFEYMDFPSSETATKVPFP
jgi:hypothetical protein